MDASTSWRRERANYVAISSVMGFWLVSLLLVLVPGADWAYAITAGVQHRSVFPAIAGLLAGYVVLTLTVAAGVATLLAASPRLETILTIAGAAYVMWLGGSLLARPAEQPGSPTIAVAPHCWGRNTLRGLGISALNPKGLLLFLALLPQFTDPVGALPIAGQIVALGAIHIVSCAIVYVCVGTGARVVLRARPTAARVVSRISGAAMLVVGIVLLIERFML
jgi:threonine/homoserine/homoserine lactone efflux protein